MPKRRSPGEGSVYRRSSGLWCGQVVVGAGRRRTCYAKTKGALLRKMDAVRVELHGGVAADRRITFGQFVDRWLRSQKELKWVTKKAYLRTLKKYGGSLWRRRLVTITDDDLTTNMDELEGVPSAARRAYRERLRQVFKYAVEHHKIPFSPATVLGPQPHKPAKRVTWERADVAAFLAAARETRLYPLFYLALATGLRAGELLGLAWRPDLDLDAGTLTVSHTWGPGEHGHGLGTPKTDSAQRKIPLWIFWNVEGHHRNPLRWPVCRFEGILGDPTRTMSLSDLARVHRPDVSVPHDPHL
jgi:hypothetical protein